MTSVTRNKAGEWIVTIDGFPIAGPFETNSQAWRWADSYTGQPLNKSQDTANWSWDRNVDRTFGQ